MVKKEINRAHSWGRETLEDVSPPEFHTAIFSSRFFYDLARRYKRKEGLLVV